MRRRLSRLRWTISRPRSFTLRWGGVLLLIGSAALSPPLAPAHAAAAPRRAPTPTLDIPATPHVPWIDRRTGQRDTTGLTKALRDRTPTTRAAAARALGQIQERASGPALIAALRDPSATVRQEAAFALGLMGDSTTSRMLGLRWESEQDRGAREMMITALGLIGAHASVPVLTRALSAGNEPERWAAALAAARLRDHALVSPLTAHADEEHAEMRWRVAYALGRIGDKTGSTALRRLAEDKVEMVRLVALRSLGEVADSGAAALLALNLKDKAWRVRVNAAHSLAMIGARDRSSAVGALLSDPVTHVRWEAALTLGALRDTASVPALTRALSDTAAGVVQGAAIALLRIQGEIAIATVAPAMDQLPAFMRSGLVEAIGGVPGRLALETLLARAKDASDPAQASGAISGLAQRRTDSTTVVPALRGLLQAPDFTIVSSALDVLGQFGDSASVPAIAAMLRRYGTSYDADVRASAASALAAIKTREALAALAGLRRDPERRIRETVVTAIGLPADSIGLVPNPLLKVPSQRPVPHVALVRTDRGVITIALDHARAPVTVENFVKLAKSKYFDTIQFHRVVPNFVVQTGCPRGDGWGGPGYMIPCEYNARPYEIGTVGMALSGKDTGGSQWFITLSPQPRLEARYTVFGQVTQGMDVVEQLMPGDRITDIVFR